MAMNPMQRKVRNSFLFGFLIAVVIAALIVGLLFMKIKKLNEDMVKMQQKEKLAMKTVYVVSESVKKGEKISTFSTSSVPAQMVPDNAITASNISDYQSEDESENSDSSAVVAKVDLSPNVILTTDMIEKAKEASTYRMVEYNMISLPSLLKEGDYIDIRIAYPAATDFVVLSKIKVESCNSTTIWLKVSESQMLTLNCAIVESYIIDGTKLYATQYANEAQSELNSTYIPNNNVIALIENNGTKAENDEISNLGKNGTVVSAREYIDKILEQYSSDDQTDKVNDGYTNEKNTIQAAREALLGDMGY
mgnify:FL=1